MIKIPYEDMKFYYTKSFYDYNLEGTCLYNGKIALYHSVDETDYQAMTDACHYCSDRTSDPYQCTCENAPNVFCYITELPLSKRIYHRLYAYLIFFWFLKNFGRNGYTYWRRWTR